MINFSTDPTSIKYFIEDRSDFKRLNLYSGQPMPKEYPCIVIGVFDDYIKGYTYGFYYLTLGPSDE